MKKILILAVMMLTTMTVSAQMRAGSWAVMPKAGFNLATVTDADDASMKFGLVAGADMIYQINEPLAISFGVLYSMQGAKAKVKEGGVTIKNKLNMDYVNIPILANFYVTRGLALKAGIQPGFNVKHKMKVESGGSSVESDIPNFKSFDFAIPIGISYEISNFVIDARYNLGVTKLWDQEGSSSKNSVFQFTLGYKIPFGWFQN